MPLKKRTIVPPSSSGGAVALPGLMAGLPDARVLENLPLDSLSPAPPEWNFYAPLPDGKFIELIESIQTNGLLHPIVVWRQPDGQYMVLSGHNRLRAYRELYRKTADRQYATIPSTVLTNITAADAHEIVVDSNWVQRNLTPSERAQSIYQKYVLAGRKKRSSNGVRRSRYDIIAEEYNLSSRQVARYIKLGSLPECLQKLLDEEKLPISTAVKLVDFSPESQQHLAEHWADRLRSKQMDRLTPDMTPEQIDATLAEESAVVRVSFQVPVRLERRFRRMAASWLAENSGDST